VQVLAIERGAARQIRHILERRDRARCHQALGASGAHPLDHAQAQTRHRPRRSRLEGAIPDADSDIHRSHLDAVALGVLHQLRRGVEAHRPGIEQPDRKAAGS
jgi:hypothetical protein